MEREKTAFLCNKLFEVGLQHFHEDKENRLIPSSQSRQKTLFSQTMDKNVKNEIRFHPQIESREWWDLARA